MPYGQTTPRVPRPRQRSIRPDDGRAPDGPRQGLTRVQVEMLRRAQGDACALCLRPLGDRWSVDHDHVLARLHGHPENVGCERCCRGILCVGCNSFLAGFHDDPVFLRRAADYAERRR